MAEEVKETKPVDSKSTEAKPAAEKSVQAAPANTAEAKPVDSKSTEAKPAAEKSTEANPTATKKHTVKVYTTPTCPWCQKTKEFLKEQGVAFSEVDVSTDQNAAQDMIKKSGQTGVPVIDVDGQIVVGFDQEKLTELLKK